MKIPFINLKALHKTIETELNEVIKEVIDSSVFINGKYNRLFCENFADYIGVKHCIGVGNGTDGLEIALLALGISSGDEVIVPANSFIATAEAVSNIGASVVFVDCAKESFCIDVQKIEEKITPKTRCIIPVHLYGQPADMDEIMQIAKKHQLFVIEDAAQAHGAVYKGKNIGSIGDMSVFSFYPGKNLGAFGDGGAVLTNNDELAEKVLMLSNHGRIDKYDHKIIGRNSRLDNLQAAILCVKLQHLNVWNQKRKVNAQLYDHYLSDTSLSQNRFGEDKSLSIIHYPLSILIGSVYHLYVIRVENRETLRKHLFDKGIETGVHYPIGLPFLEAYKFLGHTIEEFPNTYQNQSKILSLPMCPMITEEQIKYVCSILGDRG